MKHLALLFPLLLAACSSEDSSSPSETFDGQVVMIATGFALTSMSVDVSNFSDFPVVFVRCDVSGFNGGELVDTFSGRLFQFGGFTTEADLESGQTLGAVITFSRAVTSAQWNCEYQRHNVQGNETFRFSGAG